MKLNNLRQLIKEELKRTLNENMFEVGEVVKYMGEDYKVTDDDGFIVTLTTTRGNGKKENTVGLNYKQAKEKVRRATDFMNEESSLNKNITLRDLTLSDLESVASPIKMTGINQLNVNLPYPDDSMSRIDINSQYAQRNLDLYKDELVRKLGEEILDAPVILNPSEEWSSKVVIDDESFRNAKEQALSDKRSWLKGERESGRTSGLDELKKELNEIINDILEETQLNELTAGSISVDDTFTLNGDLGPFKSGDKVRVTDKRMFGSQIHIYLSDDQGNADDFIIDAEDEL